MSTRSIIAARENSGNIRAIYCHYDGYPEGVGEKLAEHYTESVKIEQLLNLGNISSLAKEIGEAHDFNKSQDFPDWCNAYGRDRGETEQEAKSFEFISELLEFAGENCAEYVYFYNGKEWKYLETEPTFQPLRPKTGE